MNFIKTILLLTVMASIHPAFANMQDFQGHWVNTDHNTRGITKMIIRTGNTAARIAVYGSCSPTDCYWGAERALPYADSVSDNITWQAKALTAVYDQGFAEKLLVIKKRSHRKLVVDVLSSYNDNRTSTIKTYTFIKRR